MPRGTLLFRCKRRVCKRKAFFRQPNINVHMYRRHILDTLGKHIRWKDTLEIVRTLQSQSRCKKKRTTKSEQNLLTIEIATPIAISIIQRKAGAIALQAPEISDRAKTNSPHDVKR